MRKILSFFMEIAKKVHGRGGKNGQMRSQRGKKQRDVLQNFFASHSENMAHNKWCVEENLSSINSRVGNDTEEMNRQWEWMRRPKPQKQLIGYVEFAEGTRNSNAGWFLVSNV